MGELSRRKYIFATSVAVFCAYCGVSQSAVMSKYGEIQPVNKYSSNPFWTPDSPYNLRFPSPIYATGPDLNTETCNNTVAALVNSYCSANNNCSKLQVSDVRPKIMVQLSQLPGHNYATSCGGYIDNAVKEYKKNHGNSFSGINVVQQPKTTKPLSLTGVVTSQPKTKSDGVAERTAELEQVQSMTTQTIDVVETDFPKTIADLSFVDRVANATAGYEPYKDLKSYHIPKFETEQEYYSRMESVLKHNINYETYNGKPKSKSPTSYLTGRGAKITWHPTREYSTFKGWCENEDLTLNPDDCPANCPMEPSIDPMSKSDKSFYACWECDAGIDLIKHNCGCPDTHMDVKNNCECKLKKLSHRDGDKCVCNDPRLDIDSDCKCPVGSHMTQDPSTGICACRDPYKTDPSDANKCICQNGGDPNSNCSCPDPNMDSNCQCPAGTHKESNQCVCDNGAGNPPDCTCPNPNADHKDPNASCACYPSDFMGSDCGCWGISTWNDTSKKCVCPITDTSNLAIPEWATVTGACTCPPTKPNFNSTTKRCEEDASGNTGDRYLVWECLGYPGNIQTVLNERKNNGNSMLDKWSTYCYTIPKDITNCIDFSHLTSTTSPVNRIFYSIKPDTNFGQQNLTGRLTAPGGELTKGEVDSFIGELISNISDVTRECTSPRREWFLFFDKLPSTGYGYTTTDVTSLTPYKALCIGGTGCTPGTITTY